MDVYARGDVANALIGAARGGCRPSGRFVGRGRDAAGEKGGIARVGDVRWPPLGRTRGGVENLQTVRLWDGGLLRLSWSVVASSVAWLHSVASARPVCSVPPCPPVLVGCGCVCCMLRGVWRCRGWRNNTVSLTIVLGSTRWTSNYDTSSRTSTRSETRERGLAHVAGVS